ncbi:hypothetical protein P7C73_g6691, partial [Tremellales sp. Uapishka_1]
TTCRTHRRRSWASGGGAAAVGSAGGGAGRCGLSATTYATLPSSPTIPVEPFDIHVADAEVSDLKQLVQLSRIPKKTYENTQTGQGDINFGIKREWLMEAKAAWEEFDWSKQQARINSFPNFKAEVKNHDGLPYTLHFVGVFSRRDDAIPLIFSHGWPGAFLEFLPMLEMVQERHTPEDLPYHLIVPSLPGYAFSSPPPLDREFSVKDIAYLFDGLMTGLGFQSYIAQGGDIGSRITLTLSQNHAACKAIHVNYKHLATAPKGTPEYKPSPQDPEEIMQQLQRYGYALEHATRPATIGLCLGSSPLALLSWIGEKYLEWSDESPSMETILTFATLYWLTDTYPSSIYTYRYDRGSMRHVKGAESVYLEKPSGYSRFPKDMSPPPVHWVKQTLNLVWSREHDEGGHFAALEKPERLWQDVTDFVAQVWEKESKA